MYKLFSAVHIHVFSYFTYFPQSMISSPTCRFYMSLQTHKFVKNSPQVPNRVRGKYTGATQIKNHQLVICIDIAKFVMFFVKRINSVLSLLNLRKFLSIHVLISAMHFCKLRSSASKHSVDLNSMYIWESSAKEMVIQIIFLNDRA